MAEKGIWVGFPRLAASTQPAEVGGIQAGPNGLLSGGDAECNEDTPGPAISLLARDAAWYYRRDGRSLQHHPGSHIAGATGRRSACATPLRGITQAEQAIYFLISGISISR